MNSVSDEKIELDIPQQTEVYRKEIRNLFKPIVKIHWLKLSVLSFIAWFLIAMNIGLVINNTKKIKQLICLKDMDLVYSSYFFISLAFIIFLIWAVVRQTIILKYFYANAEYFQNSSKFYANQNSVLFTTGNEGIKNEYTWRYINDIYLNKAGDIVLNLAGVNLTLLPKATFENEEQKQQVFDQLTTWHNNAKTAFT